MISVPRSGVRFDANPQFVPALEQLGVLLDDYRYSPHARGRVLAFTAAHGTPTGCPELDREDEADASMVFEESLPAVPYDSPAWDLEDVILDARMLADGSHPFPMGRDSDGPDVGYGQAPDESWRHPHALPPVRGGSEEAGPFEPTPADLADYHAWSEALDARRDAEAFYAAHPLGEFNALRTD